MNLRRADRTRARPLPAYQPAVDAWLTGWRALAAMDLGESAPGQPTLGSCYYDSRAIVLLERVVETMQPRRVHQLLLHELAHAIVGPCQGHNPLWREIGELIGYDDAYTFVPPIHELDPRTMQADEAYYAAVLANRQ